MAVANNQGFIATVRVETERFENFAFFPFNRLSCRVLTVITDT
jgi:hypothetical protein